MNKIIWFIGKHFPRFKLWYHKKTGKWHWGIISFIQLNANTIEDKNNPYLNDEASIWLDKHLDEIFKLKR
jgi:hypothetical protein